MSVSILLHEGWEYVVEVTNFRRPTPPPYAPTPDHAGYDDPGDEGILEFKVLSITADEEDPDYDDIMNYEALDNMVWETLL